jgi:hypothetical protein
MHFGFPVVERIVEVHELQARFNVELGIGLAVDQEVVQMGIRPAEGCLQDVVQLAQ